MLKTVAVPAEYVAASMDTAAPPLLSAVKDARAVPAPTQEEDLQVAEVEAWAP